MSESIVTRELAISSKSINHDQRTADFVASTAAVDSYDEIVEQDWILERFHSNPVILFGHQSRELPIGQAIQCGVEGGKLLVRIKFSDAHEKAREVWRLVQEGVLRAVSVGFRPRSIRSEKRDGKDIYVLSQNELHEISVVTIPANAEALARMKSAAREKGLAASGQAMQAFADRVCARLDSAPSEDVMPLLEAHERQRLLEPRDLSDLIDDPSAGTRDEPVELADMLGEPGEDVGVGDLADLLEDEVA